jgi:hypothetical protein
MIKSLLQSSGGRRTLLSLSVFILLANSETQAQQQSIAPPSGSGAFGTSVVVLTNGNYVVTDPVFDDGAVADVGAVYLYNGNSHALISTLKGSVANSQVGNGGITTLPNGNFVVGSPSWNDGVSAWAGAATFVNGTTGLNATVSSTNSLVGSTTKDSVGNRSSITVLTNGNYVVGTPLWDDGGTANVGAITWASGTSGITGTINAVNSLVGSKANDVLGGIGNGRVFTLTNGNYVVLSPAWDNGTIANAGAVTWCSGTGGTVGAVSSTNSLVGSKANDFLGSVYSFLTPLSNGNYVVCSPDWDNGTMVDAGAATWGNGTTGISGTINSSNSMIGSSAGAVVGSGGATALTNGNYVIKSLYWKNGTVSNAGASTWGNGTTGTSGIVSSSNSLVGSLAGDLVTSGGVFPLPNGNYLTCSFHWANTSSAPLAGAITLCDGIAGTTTGAVSTSNSLVGTHAGDQVGAYLPITLLTNGNFVAVTVNWNSGVGAVTWVNSTTGLTGPITTSNSLTGSSADQSISNTPIRVIPLNNGNYVVASPDWDNGSSTNAGAVTWANGLTGITGTISSANSLVGISGNSRVGSGGVITFPSSNYVVASPGWRNGTAGGAGAVTYCNGTTGTTGTVSSSNSLVGSIASDSVGSNGLLALSNGSYVVASPKLNIGTGLLDEDAGAVTWCNASGTTTGPVSSCNSLVGSTYHEMVGNVKSVALANGNYLTGTSNWDNGTTSDVGARTMGGANAPLTGTINSCNSFTETNGAGTSITQVNNPVYNYTLVINSTINSLVAFYGTPTDQTLAGNLDSSSVAICPAVPSPFVTKSGCRIIGTVQQAGALPVTGRIKSKTWIETAVPVQSGEPYVARHSEVVLETNPSTGTSRVTLYFTQQEFTDFNAHPGSAANLPTGPSDAAGIANLRIGKFNGASANHTGIPNTYPGTVSVIDPADADIVWNATKSWWEVTFDMTGSAGLIIQTFTQPLSLDLLEFSGTLRNDDAVLNWKTENENNTTGFDVERSTDAKSFSYIGFVSSANRAGINYYNFVDKNISALQANEIYYRLKEKNADGLQKYSQVVRLSLEGKNSVTLYPNPATMKATLAISLTTADKLQLRILDNIGRVVQHQQVSCASGTTNLNVDLSQLAPGVYYVELRGNNLNERKQIVKQ